MSAVNNINTNVQEDKMLDDQIANYFKISNTSISSICGHFIFILHLRIITFLNFLFLYLYIWQIVIYKCSLFFIFLFSIVFCIKVGLKKIQKNCELIIDVLCIYVAVFVLFLDVALSTCFKIRKVIVAILDFLIETLIKILQETFMMILIWSVVAIHRYFQKNFWPWKPSLISNLSDQ